ncbi:MAG: hypothetical protein RML72_02785 [Bacteroidia bacterium]|nr:hypothetical protein [Bacteroidia bacterium]MDW8157786.1 hypothetical protein [Bacteroidia bacterium]
MKQILKAVLGFSLVIGLLNSNAFSQLPNFKFYNSKKEPFTKANIKPDLATVVFLFNPYCETCQGLGTAIIEAQNLFKETQFLFVTQNEELSALTYFSNEILIPSKRKHPFYLVRDLDYEFDTFFGKSDVPTILVYNKAGKLVKRYTKEATAAEIAKATTLP